MSSRERCVPLLGLALALAMVVSSTALAVPYASAVRDLGGDMWEFVLNESADSVTVTRDGGNPFVINSPTAGRYTFDMTGFGDFEIAVDKSAPQGWSRISDPSNLYTNFERPTGLAVNTNPASAYFGTIYVSNSREESTVSGRAMGDGVYALTSDTIGVDFSTWGVTDPQDATQAKAPEWTVAGSSTSAWRLAIDDGGNVIASDFSDANGGVKYATPDLMSGGLVLDQEGGPDFGVQNPMDDYIHGSMSSKPTVTGTVGVDLILWGMDEDLESIPEISFDGDNLWRWDVGSATDYDGAPTLVANTNNLQFNGIVNVNSEGGLLLEHASSYWNMHYEERFNKYYITSRRFDGNESGLLILTPDGDDGQTPNVDWASGQFSIDNQLDGWFDNPECSASIGTNDIFRFAGSATVSEDGTKLLLHRSGVPDPMIPDTNCANVGEMVDYDNVYLGQNSNLPGAVLVIPLDENGLPNIEIDDNDTPLDPTDDFITNMESITVASNNADRRFANEVRLDAAGNLYITNNVSELLEVFSPGGNTRAITTSAGSFSVEELSAVDGDFNNDGFWTCADINMLTAEIAAEGMNLAFDMNGDGMISLADVTGEETGWLAVGGRNNAEDTDGNAFLEGDANLDGVVDVSDFNEWNGNKFSEEDAWCLGDFNADGSVDVSDFNIWNSFKFQRSSDGMAAVPEPHAVLLNLTGVLALAGCRRRR